MRMSVAPNAILQPYNLSDKMRGMMAETFVAEQLVANGFSLHYWTSGNSAEVDFVVQQDNHSIPIEIKSSNNVKAKSLQIYIKNIFLNTLFAYLLKTLVMKMKYVPFRFMLYSV